MHRVIMRSPVLALSLFAAACTANSPTGTESFDSVRERLREAPTRLFIGGEDSTGLVTARRWTQDGWIAGDHTLTIESGELHASVDASGRLELTSFEVGVAPIELPEEVFKKPAQLSDVKVKLVESTAGAAQWTSENEATARLTLKLDLEWAISVNGGKTPLGEQKLPPIDVDFTLSGDGDFVGATIALAASGELWSWAGLLELTKLELQLGAQTTD
jgi:hypothetical protein